MLFTKRFFPFILLLVVGGCTHSASSKKSDFAKPTNPIEVICESCNTGQINQIQTLVAEQSQVQKVFILKDQQNWYASWTSTKQGFSVSKVQYQSFEHLCKNLLHDLNES